MVIQCIWLVLSHVQLFVTPWTVAHQLPLSMKFSRHEYWSGLLFPPPGDLPVPGIELMPLASPALAGKFFSTEPPGKPNMKHNLVHLGYLSTRGDYFYVMKCTHSKGNPHQTPGRQRENHLPSMLLLQTNFDVTV